MTNDKFPMTNKIPNQKSQKNSIIYLDLKFEILFDI